MMTETPVTVAARLDRLPPSRHTRRLITLISLGGWFEFYDLFFTAYIAIGLFKAGIFKPTTQGLFDLQGFASFVAALFLGLFIGTLAFSLAIRQIRPPLYLHLRAVVVLDRRADYGVPGHVGIDKSVAAHCQHRARRRTRECRHLCVGTGAEESARTGLRL